MRKDHRASPDIFIPEFPARCNGSFCHQRNIIRRNRFKLCPECRVAKRRHSYNERGRWWNRERINNCRRLRRYNRAQERSKGTIPRMTGMRAFARITGMRFRLISA
jgi:hypothetical protein